MDLDHKSADVVETEVVIKTADGEADASFSYPKGDGPWPAVVMFTDALGLRPSSRAMGARMAAEGYAVLTPNPFYRAIKGAPFPNGFDFSDPNLRATFMEYRKALTPDAVARDATAWLGFLDAQPVVDAKVKAGVSGYCMGGSMTMQAAAALPDRIGAAASFHGGGQVTDSPDSPHLLVPKIKAISYFGVATNDDAKEPEVKDKLRAAYEAAGAPMKLEVYEGADHGWCMDDMPPYNPAQAERAWTKLLGLFKKALV